MLLKNIPLQIPFSSGCLYGILRNAKDAEKLIILCPAATGTRIGPQRIFVEITQALLENQIASFCVDFPPLGDSYDNQIQKYEGSYAQRLSLHYAKYLNIIIDQFNENHTFQEIYLLSISDGCMPVYNFAQQNKRVNGLILLSPNHKLDTVETVNKKNIKQYLYKVFKKDTWHKLVTLNLNYSKIFKNIFHKPVKQKNRENIEVGSQGHIPRLLTIFGEKEVRLEECIDFWKSEIKKSNCSQYSNRIIDGADHSFFGWQFKRDVERWIVEWFKEGEKKSCELIALSCK